MTERPDDSIEAQPEEDTLSDLQDLRLQFQDFVLALWQSSGQRVFIALSVGMVGVIIATAGMQVVLNAWNKPFYDAIEQKNVSSFLSYLMVFGGIAGILLGLNVAQTWLDQMIKLQSRKWLTRDLINQWLKPRRLVLLRDAGEIGVNPDQRVHEDARHLAELSAGLGIGLFQSSLLLVSFITVLWNLSSGIVLVFDGTTLAIPGYMVWSALIYAATGSWLSWRVGRPLINIGVERYAREADMRFALVQVSENANGIVLNAGEPDEQQRLKDELDRLLAVIHRLVNAIARLTWITAGYGWVGIVAPIVIAAPGYFGGQLSFGQLMMVVGAFNQVQNSLRWFVDNFSAIADWRATLDRVMTFRAALISLEEQRSDEGRIIYEPDPDGGLLLENVSVRWTDNSAALSEPRIDVVPGDRLLIVDRTGSGRGILFSALAGLWPWGSGKILLPARSKAMFLPERPYVPDGTLRAALTYPAPAAGFSDADLEAALDRVELGRLKPSLDRKARWGRELSFDEEERLTFARLMLLKPEWIFSEQPIDALEEDQRVIFRSIMENDLAHSAMVTVSSRPTTSDFYDRTADLLSTERKTGPAAAPRQAKTTSAMAPDPAGSAANNEVQD